MDKTVQEYILALLEEIRLLTASQLLIMARLRDDYRGYTDSDERTYKVATAEVEESFARMKALYNRLQKIEK